MKSFTEIYDEDVLTETPNLNYDETGIPFPIWVDLPKRQMPHNSPRLKIKIDGQRYPISLSKNPRWLTPNIPRIQRTHMKLIRKFIDINYDNLKSYWDDDISEDELRAEIIKV